MSADDKLAPDTPCCDSGSVFKWWFNPGKVFRTPNRKLANTPTTVVVGSGAHTGEGTTEFVNAATKKLLFFCYRNCFPALPNGSTTDIRWGCLVRTTQMLCGTCLLRYHCKGAYVLPEEGNAALKRKVAPLFMDVPAAPLGIHKVEDRAYQNSVKYASMLSPTEAGMAMAAALRDCHAQGGDVPYTVSCEDRNIDQVAVLEKLEEGQHVILIIPVVLGIAPISDKYQIMMLKILDMKSSCGIAGGYKQASFYMFGHQGSSVFFLDPHYIQKAYTSEKTAGSLDGARGELEARRFDPCMVLGFYLHTPADYHVFAEELAAINSIVVFPLISFSRKPPATAEERAMTAEEQEADLDTANQEGDAASNPLAPGHRSAAHSTSAFPPQGR